MGANAARTADAPFTGQFVFTVDGVEIGSFTEASGLSVEVEVEELQEGGQNQFVHKLPGPMSWPNIVLKAGVTDSVDLFTWLSKSSGEGFSGNSNSLTRESGTITLIDGKNQPIRSWTFAGAFPVRWTGPTLAAGSSELAQEELEIAHHGFIRG